MKTQFDKKLISILKAADIPNNLISTPFEVLLQSHNLEHIYNSFEKPKLIILTCIDYRINLHLPENFAYIIRLAGANVDNSEFSLLFSLAYSGIKYVAVLHHTDCAMSKLQAIEDKIFAGLTKNLKMTSEKAKSYIKNNFPNYKLNNEILSATTTANKLTKSYSEVKFLPLIYNVENQKIYIIKD